MKTSLRRTIRSSIAFGCLGLALVGCRASAPTSTTPLAAGMVPLPPIEREVGPDGSEIVVTPSPDAPAAPRSWMRKVGDFCTPKPPPKSDSDRAYESDNVPYSS